MAAHSRILAWKIPWTQSLVGHRPWGHKESDMTEQLHFTHIVLHSDCTSLHSQQCTGVSFLHTLSNIYYL